MTDVRLGYKNLRFDLDISQGDLVTDPGLETSVAISLFTDQRVSPEELPPGETDRRGWYGDEMGEFRGDLTGSKLWLLDRAKATPQTRAKVEEYAREALRWLIEDGVAVAVNVRAVLVDRESIELYIEIERPNVKHRYYYRYQLLWEGQVMQARRVS